jgi:4-hydroxybenzoate polyprenyltransferase
MVQDHSLLEYLKLFRLQTGATTALAPVIGYLVIAMQLGYPTKWLDIVIIFFIGILMHIFEFVLNEYIDEDVDRRSPNLAQKPLVKGSISSGSALIVAFGSMAAAYLITIIYFFNVWSLIILTLAFEFGAIYDIYGKRFAGSDFMLALWIFFFCLFGASIVSINFTGLLLLVAGLGFFQILFNNGIEGGIKDSDHDAVAGAKTMAAAMGVKVRNNKLITPGPFKVASYSIKLGYMMIVILIIYHLIFQSGLPIDLMQFVLIIIFSIIIFYTLNRFLTIPVFDRSKLKRIFSIHEIATFYLSAVLLLHVLGMITVIGLALLPLIWYMVLNVLLYGKPLEPRV